MGNTDPAKANVLADESAQRQAAVEYWLKLIHQGRSFEVCCLRDKGNAVRGRYGRGPDFVELERKLAPHAPARRPTDPPQTVAEIAAFLVNLDQGKQGAEKPPAGIYTTLQEISRNRIEALDAERKAVRNQDIGSYLWLFVDIDPIKPPDQTYNPATEAETEQAVALARRITDDLAAEGWPAPVACASGNGSYLLYRIDLDNDDASRRLVRDCLQALAHRYGEKHGARVDTSTWSPGQLVKVMGTTSRKGQASPDRPWRETGVLRAPPEVTVVPRTLLEALAAFAADPAGSDTSPLPTLPVDVSRAASSPREPITLEAMQPLEYPEQWPWHFMYEYVRDVVPQLRERNALDAGNDPVERCRRYLQKIRAISGRGGHNTTFQAACETFRFGLTGQQALEALKEWNGTNAIDGQGRPCHWSDEELTHKLRGAWQTVIEARELGAKLDWTSRKGGTPAPATPVPVMASAPPPTGPAASAAEEAVSDPAPTTNTSANIEQAKASPPPREADAAAQVAPVDDAPEVQVQVEQPTQQQHDAVPLPGEAAKEPIPIAKLPHTIMPLGLIERVRDATGRQILAVLAHELGPDERKWCQLDEAELARRCGISVRTLQRRLKQLSDGDLLTIERSARTGANRYRLLLPDPGESGDGVDRQAWLDHWLQASERTAWNNQYIRLLHGLPHHLTPLARQIFGLVLLRSRDGRGAAQFSRATLARQLGGEQGPAAVRTAIGQLVTAGLLREHRRSSTGPSNRLAVGDLSVARLVAGTPTGYPWSNLAPPGSDFGVSATTELPDETTESASDTPNSASATRQKQPARRQNRPTIKGTRKMEANKKEKGESGCAAPPPSPFRRQSARAGGRGVAGSSSSAHEKENRDSQPGTSIITITKADEEDRQFQMDIGDLGNLHGDADVQAAWSDHATDLESVFNLIAATDPPIAYICGPTRTGKTQLVTAALGFGGRQGQVSQGVELEPLLTNTTFMSKVDGNSPNSAAHQLQHLREVLNTSFPNDADTVQDAVVAMLIASPGMLVLDDVIREGESAQQLNRKLTALDRVIRQRLEPNRLYQDRETVVLANLNPDQLRRRLRNNEALAERLLSGLVIEVTNPPYGSARGRGRGSDRRRS